MMVLMSLYCWIHYLHHTHTLNCIFHFGQMCWSYKHLNHIFYFGRVCWYWNLLSRCLPLHSQLGLWLPQTCYCLCKSCHCWMLMLTQFQRNFSLGGCIGTETVICNVIVAVIVRVRKYFTFGGCLGVTMSNAWCTGTVAFLSLELAQWSVWEGLFRLVAFSSAHCWQIGSEVFNSFCPGLW